MNRRILYNVGIICAIFICICLLFPITESLSKKLGENFFEGAFDIPFKFITVR